VIPAIHPEIEQYLAVQERYEALRKQTQLMCGRELSDLGYANAYDGPPPEAINAIREALDSSRTLDLQYTPYGGTTITRRLIATGLTSSHRLQFDWREIVMTPGAMAALNVLFRALKTSGDDEVVIVTPAWIDYPLYLANLGIKPVFAAVDPTSLRLDIGRIAAALRGRGFRVDNGGEQGTVVRNP
jgi:aspartate aminotransferase